MKNTVVICIVTVVAMIQCTENLYGPLYSSVFVPRALASKEVPTLMQTFLTCFHWQKKTAA